MKEIEAIEKKPFRAQEDYTEELYIQKEKGKISGLLAMLLTVLYALYIFFYFNDIGMDSLTGYIAMRIVMPHMVCVVVAAVFACIGFFGKKRWAMLTSGILLAVSAVLMMSYAPMVIVQAVLCFISYARMGSYKEVRVK